MIGLKHAIAIVAGLILFLLILYPPWLGELPSPVYAPLFSPPKDYTVILEYPTPGREAKYEGARLEWNPVNGRLEPVGGRIVEEAIPGTPGRYAKRQYAIDTGRLLTTLLAVVGVAFAMYGLVVLWRKRV